MSRLYISTYHYTRDLWHSRYPKIKGLDVALFKQQLDFLEQNFSVVRMEDVMEAADGGKELAPNHIPKPGPFGLIVLLRPGEGEEVFVQTIVFHFPYSVFFNRAIKELAKSSEKRS